MEKYFDTLRFELFDPYEAGERWAVEYNHPDCRTVKIFINNKELNSLLVELEDKEDGVDNPTDSANVYGHIGPYYLLKQLKSEFASNYGASLCCCAECGDDGCWGVTTKVHESEQEVVWHDFEHEHRPYTYGGLEFHFERCAYDAEIKKLEKLAEQCEFNY